MRSFIFKALGVLYNHVRVHEGKSESNEKGRICIVLPDDES